MPDKKTAQTSSSTERLAALTKQGRAWKFVEELARFERPGTFLDAPMEITVAMIRGLRMVDETVVVHGRLSEFSSDGEKEKGEQ